MRHTERILAAVALIVVGYVFTTRFHDDIVSRDAAVCMAEKPPERISECGVYEKKFLYLQPGRTWGNSAIADRNYRNDFGEVVWSLLAAAPWAILRSIRRLRGASR